MKQNNWEKIEKEFDKEFVLYFMGELGEGIMEDDIEPKAIKQFLHKTIIDVLDEAIGEEREFCKGVKRLKIKPDMYKQFRGEVCGYNQKRNEIIKLKERLT